MNRSKLFAMVAGALVAGVVLGSVSSGFAATTTTSTTNPVAAACSGLGLAMGSAVRDGGGRLLDVVAKLTGQSTAEVTAERQSGKTFAQIAQAEGVSTTNVVDSALKVRSDILTAKVKAGTITQAQADSALATMKTRLTQRVDSVNTACGSGAGGGCGMGGGNGAGCGGGGCGGGGCAGQ